MRKVRRYNTVTELKIDPLLVCPSTKLPLAPVARPLACSIAPNAPGLSRLSDAAHEFLLRSDGRCLYPVIDGVPILISPEAVWTEPRQGGDVNHLHPRFAEAYEEMAHYNAVAQEEAAHIVRSESYKAIEPVLRAGLTERRSFPNPRGVWLDAVYDCVAQGQAYRFIAPVSGKRVIQLGGKGIHAVKFLLAGASEAWLITPMVGEAQVARALANVAGVSERFHCAVGVGEELPLTSDSFDIAYSGGCLHHMLVEEALPECARILRSGGRFAAIDPWKTPFHTIGTRIFGKREPGVKCHPLNAVRLKNLSGSFPSGAITSHGALTRYGLLVLQKLGLTLSLTAAWKIMRADDALCRSFSFLRNWGSSVAVLGEKAR
jgi:uncharacterized protein YbaR (Trm112 family)